MKNKEDVKQFFSWNIIIIQFLKIIISETEAKIISSLESFFSFPNINGRILKGERFSFLNFPLPSLLTWIPEKKCQRARFESSAKKFLSLSLCPAGLTGPAGDAGASVATGMSRNARRTVTPTSIARCCTAWHGDNHRPRTRREEKVDKDRERERGSSCRTAVNERFRAETWPSPPSPSTLSPPHFEDRSRIRSLVGKYFLSSSSKKEIYI